MKARRLVGGVGASLTGQFSADPSSSDPLCVLEGWGFQVGLGSGVPGGLDVWELMSGVTCNSDMRPRLAR